MKSRKIVWHSQEAFTQTEMKEMQDFVRSLDTPKRMLTEEEADLVACAYIQGLGRGLDIGWYWRMAVDLE